MQFIEYTCDSSQGLWNPHCWPGAAAVADQPEQPGEKEVEVTED
jgi:hypothetical protein